MRKAALYILLPAALALALAWIFRPAPVNPPGVSPDRYDYPTPDERDSIWQAITQDERKRKN